jgi:predicted outer membrane repeat protein
VLKYLICILTFILASCGSTDNENNGKEDSLAIENDSLLFFEDFSGKRHNWQLDSSVMGVAKIENGLLNLLSNKAYNKTEVIKVDLRNNQNFCFEISLKLCDESILCGFTYYNYLIYLNNRVVTAEIEERPTSENKRNYLSEQLIHVQLNKSFTVKAEKNGNRVKFFVDNKYVFTQMVSDYSSTFDISLLYIDSGKAQIDNLKIYKLNVNTNPQKNLIVNHNASDFSSGSLNYAIENIADDGVIRFNNDLVFNLDNEFCIGDKSLIIDGGNHKVVFDGNCSEFKPDKSQKTRCRAFSIFGKSKIVFKNIVFKNFNGNKGGAIYKYNDGKVTFEKCIFINNKSEEGGAVYTNSHVHFKNCLFISNSVDDDGGAIFSEDGMSVDHCIFIDNIGNNNATDNYSCKSDSILESFKDDWKEYEKESKKMSSSDAHDAGEALSDLEIFSTLTEGGGSVYSNNNSVFTNSLFLNSYIRGGCVNKIQNCYIKNKYESNTEIELFTKMPNKGNDSIWGTKDDNYMYLINDSIKMTGSSFILR